MRLWQRLLDALDAHGTVAMASVIGMQGSTPRETGARVVALPDGSFFGTIGGGTLEWRALADLQALLARPGGKPFQTRSVALGPDLGQCCGGRVDLAYELFDPAQRETVARLAAFEAEGPFRTIALVDGSTPLDRVRDEAGSVAIGAVRLRADRLEEGFGEAPRRLFLFGAGHVGRALVLALAPLPFAVTWVDPRPDAFPARVPGNVTCIETADPPSVLDAAGAGDFVLVMTHNHGLDLAITDAALRGPGIAYLGVIGSASKRARFRRLLDEAGHTADDVARMIMPIGVAGIRSKLPAAIALAVAADLLMRDEAAQSVEADNAGTLDTRSALTRKAV